MLARVGRFDPQEPPQRRVEHSRYVVGCISKTGDGVALFFGVDARVHTNDTIHIVVRSSSGARTTCPNHRSCRCLMTVDRGF